MKAKLFSVWHHESLFSVLRDWKYTKNSAVTVVKHEDLENNEVYKLWSFKGSYRSHREFPKDDI